MTRSVTIVNTFPSVMVASKCGVTWLSLGRWLRCRCRHIPCLDPVGGEQGNVVLQDLRHGLAYERDLLEPTEPVENGVGEETEYRHRQHSVRYLERELLVDPTLHDAGVLIDPEYRQ